MTTMAPANYNTAPHLRAFPIHPQVTQPSEAVEGCEHLPEQRPHVSAQHLLRHNKSYKEELPAGPLGLLAPR